MFEAFQFGFGHDTDEEIAEVIVTLQMERRNEIFVVNFKHSKTLERRRIVDTFGIQVVNTDADYRVRFCGTLFLQNCIEFYASDLNNS